MDIIIEEIVNHENLEKSETEVDIFEAIEELRYPQDFNSDSAVVIILNGINQKEIIDSRIQPMFKRSRHNNISVLIFSQEYYELPKHTIRANGNIYHIFKPNNFRDFQKFYQEKTSMDMTLKEINF